MLTISFAIKKKLIRKIPNRSICTSSLKLTININHWDHIEGVWVVTKVHHAAKHVVSFSSLVLQTPSLQICKCSNMHRHLTHQLWELYWGAEWWHHSIIFSHWHHAEISLRGFRLAQLLSGQSLCQQCYRSEQHLNEQILIMFRQALQSPRHLLTS